MRALTRSRPRQVVNLLAGIPVDGEPARAKLLCNDYVRLGPKRTFKEVQRRFNAQDGIQKVSYGQVHVWATRYSWKERAEDYDRRLDDAKTAAAQREMEEVLNSGISLSYERVKRLKALEEMIFEDVENNLWTEENRQMAGELVINRVFNAKMVRALLDIYADVAAEVGGRRQKIDQTTVSMSVSPAELLRATEDVRQTLANRFKQARENGPGSQETTS